MTKFAKIMGGLGRKWRVRLWIVLSALLVGAFYIDNYFDKTVLFYYIGAEILLLVAIVCWTWVRSANHMEVCFKENFHNFFNSYLTGFVLVVLLAAAASYLWGIACNIVFCNGARTFFLENRRDDIIDCVIRAPFKEEAIYRLLPFVAASIPMFFVKSKIRRVVIAIVALLMIICVQVQFGYKHYSPIFETSEKIVEHIILQGTMGVFYAVSYGSILFLSYNAITENQKQSILMKPLVISHVLAFLASSLAHAFSNLSLIISLTF